MAIFSSDGYGCTSRATHFRIAVEALDPAFRANGCAAFSIEDGESAQLVVVQELEARHQSDTNTLVARLQAELAERHEVFDLSALLLC